MSSGYEWDGNGLSQRPALQALIKLRDHLVPQLRLPLDSGDKGIDTLSGVGYEAEEGDSRWRLSLASILQRIREDVRVKVRLAREDHDRDVMLAGRLDSHATTAILVLKDDEIRQAHWPCGHLAAQDNTPLMVQRVRQLAAVLTFSVIGVEVYCTMLVVRSPAQILHAMQVPCQPHRQLVRGDGARVRVVRPQPTPLLLMRGIHKGVAYDPFAPNSCREASRRLREKLPDALRDIPHQQCHGRYCQLHERLERGFACIWDHVWCHTTLRILRVDHGWRWVHLHAAIARYRVPTTCCEHEHGCQQNVCNRMRACCSKSACAGGAWARVCSILKRLTLPIWLLCICFKSFCYRAHRVARQVVQTVGVVTPMQRLDNSVSIEEDDFAQKTAAWSLHNPSLFLALVRWGEETGPQVDIYVGVL